MTAVAVGDGAGNASRRLAAVLEACRPDRVALVGVAGALSEDLAIGEVVRAARIVTVAADGSVTEGPSEESRGSGDASPGWRRRPAGEGSRAATVVSWDRMAVTARAKARLSVAVGGGVTAVVDLETAACAAVAAAAGVPFLALRSVSDGSHEDLPLDFNRFVGPDGSIDRARVMRHIALRPALMPRLLELRRRVADCSERLADAVDRLLR